MPVIKKDGEPVAPLRINEKPIILPLQKVDDLAEKFRNDFDQYERNATIQDAKILAFMFGVFLTCAVGLGAAQLINEYFSHKAKQTSEVKFDPCKGMATYPDPNGNIICAPAGQHLGAGIQSEWDVKK